MDKPPEIFNEIWYSIWFTLSGCGKWVPDVSPEMPLWHDEDRSPGLVLWHQPPMYLPDYARRWCWARVHPYRYDLWRLSNKRLTKPPEQSLEGYLYKLPAPKWTFELLFHSSETQSVATDSLVRFVTSSFTEPHRTRAYQWPLFCQHRTYPQQAWTELAEKGKQM